MVNYLTPEQVLFIHTRLIIETGGEDGLRDLGLLQSAIARPKATFDAQDFYPYIFTKTAALLESLIGNHAFVDGNKRTAIASAGLFLRLNGFQLRASNSEIEVFTLQCVRRLFSLEANASWFRHQSKSIQ